MLTLPGMGFDLPSTQLLQALLLDAPVCALYVPGLHCSKVIARLAAPVPAQNPPASHCAHAVAASPLLNRPCSQGGQTFGCPLTLENVPGLQGMHVAMLAAPTEGR